ncbi:hypothetical protein EON63_14285 [archaeon]|nr:MAG: hypothetical protein EON63_14285 [archaeon]
MIEILIQYQQLADIFALLLFAEDRVDQPARTRTLSGPCQWGRSRGKMKQVLVTVGTTEFDELIKAIDNEAFLVEMLKVGCEKLLIQYGRGVYLPSQLPQLAPKYNITLTMFQFDPSLPTIISESNLMIGHCGAGTILDAVTTHTKMVVVVNPTLQGNHQLELAHVLEKHQICKITYPDHILKCLQECFEENMVHNMKLPSFPIMESERFARTVESMFDFS